MADWGRESRVDIILGMEDMSYCYCGGTNPHMKIACAGNPVKGSTQANCYKQ